MSIAITAPLTAWAAKGISEARETAAAMAQVQASLASMGPVAGRTTEQLTAMADQLERTSLFEGDQILGDVTATLLTFGNVQGTVFDRAQQAAVDLATKFKTDLGSAAVQVGKALNDPVKGVTALTRVGVSFTAQQKEQIAGFVATGQAAKAQGIILAELERQVGGSAAAAQAADPWNRFSDSLNALAEQIGTKVLPLLPPLIDKFSALVDTFLNLPEPMQNLILGAGALGAALGPVVIGVGGAIAVFGKLLPVLTKLPALLTVAGTAFRFMLGPIGLAITAAGALYLAWKNWDKIAPILQNLYTAAKTWLLDKLGKVIDWVADKVRNLTEPFRYLWDKVVGHSYIPDMVDAIGQHMARLDALMVQPATAAADKVSQRMRELAAELQPLMDRLFPEVKSARETEGELALLKRARDLQGAAVNDEARRRLIAEKLGPMIGDIAETMAGTGAVIGDAVAGITDGVSERWADIVAANDNLQRSFEDTMRGVSQSLAGLVRDIRSGDWLSGLQSILDIALQLGSVGVLGKQVQARINLPARADGGPVTAGQTYMVGERGPELFTARRSGYIHPNGSNDNGGRAAVTIVPSPYFDAHVDGRAARVAAPMAQSAAAGGMQGARQQSARRQARSIP